MAWRAPTSAAFKAWFGASKVVDHLGRPLRVYHGTHRGGFDTFGSGGRHRIGFFFSDDPKVAWTYTRSDTFDIVTKKDRRVGEPGIYEVYLHMERPLVVDAGGALWDNISANSLGHNERDVREALRDHRSDSFITDDLAFAARALGYDGLIVQNVVDDIGGEYGLDDSEYVSTIYVVFDPLQVKSANMNSGKYSMLDENILKNPRAARRPVYHLTYASDLPSIARQGLVPRADTETAWNNAPGVYFVSTFGYEAGAPESEEPAWLCFPAPAMTPPRFFDGGMHEACVNATIPPEVIKVWVDGRGRPVSSSDKGRWKPLVR